TNDVVRLHALIDRRKVIITEDIVRQALRLDDAKSIDYLLTAEIFAELERMGTVWNEFSSSMASVVICLATGGCIQIGGIIAEIDADEDVTLEEVDAEKDVEVAEKDAAVQGRQKESQSQVYHINLEHAKKVLSMQDDEVEPAKLKEVIEVVTTVKLMTEVVTAAATPITAAPSAARRRKGVVIRDPKKKATLSIIVHSEPKSKDKGKVLRYQALKRKPQTEVPSRKNMMVYLKDMAGFKMDFFKGMSYDDIRPIFAFQLYCGFPRERRRGARRKASKALKKISESFEQQAAKKQKLDEEVEKLKTHLQIILNDEDDVYTEGTPLALKVPVIDYQIHTENSKPHYKIIRADGTHQLFLSFISLLRNFDRGDLEMLWQII
nr:hypothetical protein [Tanacetum cinerariifolium]